MAVKSETLNTQRNWEMKSSRRTKVIWYFLVTQNKFEDLCFILLLRVSKVGTFSWHNKKLFILKNKFFFLLFKFAFFCTFFVASRLKESHLPGVLRVRIDYLQWGTCDRFLFACKYSKLYTICSDTTGFASSRSKKWCFLNFGHVTCDAPPLD